jgi:hypothetical protein
MSGEKTKQNMQIFRLLANKFTNAFTIYKSIYKGHLQKWMYVCLECKFECQSWVQKKNNPATKNDEKKKLKFETKKTKLNKAKNINKEENQKSKQNNKNFEWKKVFKKLTYVSKMAPCAPNSRTCT